jgi:hypothetical protein
MLRLRSGLRHICFRKAPANVMYPRTVSSNIVNEKTDLDIQFGSEIIIFYLYKPNYISTNLKSENHEE